MYHIELQVEVCNKGTGLMLQYNNTENNQNKKTGELYRCSRRPDDDGHTNHTPHHHLSQQPAQNEACKKTHHDYNRMSLQQRWCEYPACIASTVCFLCPRTALSFLPRLYFGCYALSRSSGLVRQLFKTAWKWNSAVFSELSLCSQFLIVATRRCLLPSSFPFLLCFFTLM